MIAFDEYQGCELRHVTTVFIYERNSDDKLQNYKFHDYTEQTTTVYGTFDLEFLSINMSVNVIENEILLYFKPHIKYWNFII